MKKLAYIGLLIMLGALFISPSVSAHEWETCDSPDETITITSDGPTSYDKDTIENVSEDACIKITLKNTSSAAHDFEIEDADGEVVADIALVQGGEEASIMVHTPAKGEYTFFCSVPTHRESGMEGKFIVGGSSSSPGFGFFITFVGLVGLVAIITRFRK